MTPDTTDTAEQRLVVLEGCFNFRDAGGYVTGDGRPIRWGRLFRADGLSRLTAADLTCLEAYGPLTILDLRTNDEITERGRIPESAPVTYHHLPMVDVLPPHEELALWLDAPTIAARYRDMLDEGAGSVCEALAILTDPAAYPAVVHCAAGKDRTGILIGLILGLLGVDDEVIAADYALSAPAMQKMLARIREEHPDALDVLDRYSTALLAADPATMIHLLRGLRADYGSLAGYVEHLGMGDVAGHLRAVLV